MAEETELVDVVNEKGDFLYTAKRADADKQGLMYKASKVFVFNSLGDNLVIKRSKDANGCPGYYDIGVSETVKPGEEYKEAALRGLEEEIGIRAKAGTELKFLCSHVYQAGRMKRAYEIFVLQNDSAIRCGTQEIEEASFMGEDELNRLLENKEKVVPAGLELWRKYLALTRPAEEQE